MLLDRVLQEVIEAFPFISEGLAHKDYSIPCPRRDNASRKADAGCASSESISRQTAASSSSTLVSSSASTLCSLIPVHSPFPRAQTMEVLPQQKLPGMRYDQLQALGRLAADGEHLVAHTHDA